MVDRDVIHRYSENLYIPRSDQWPRTSEEEVGKPCPTRTRVATVQIGRTLCNDLAKSATPCPRRLRRKTVGKNRYVGRYAAGASGQNKGMTGTLGLAGEPPSHPDARHLLKIEALRLHVKKNNLK